MYVYSVPIQKTLGHTRVLIKIIFQWFLYFATFNLAILTTLLIVHANVQKQNQRSNL